MKSSNGLGRGSEGSGCFVCAQSPQYLLCVLPRQNPSSSSQAYWLGSRQSLCWIQLGSLSVGCMLIWGRDRGREVESGDEEWKIGWKEGKMQGDWARLGDWRMKPMLSWKKTRRKWRLVTDRWMDAWWWNRKDRWWDAERDVLLRDWMGNTWQGWEMDGFRDKLRAK